MLIVSCLRISIFFFFNDTATTEIYTLSLHDALPIFLGLHQVGVVGDRREGEPPRGVHAVGRSEEHTSELQSHLNLVCRLLLEKKKLKIQTDDQGRDDGPPRKDGNYSRTGIAR